MAKRGTPRPITKLNNETAAMPTFSRSLEQSLHRASGARQRAASRIRHARAPAARADRRPGRGRGHAGLQRRPRQAAAQPDVLSRIRAREPGHRRQRGLQADRRLPARDPARRDPRAVLRPRGGDRRQRAGRDLRRAREPCRLFPARAGHDPLRRGQLHQPRHRQAAGHVGIAPGARRRGGDRRQERRRAEEEGRRARSLLRQPQQEGARGQDRPADRARAPRSAAPSRCCAGGRRTTRCSSATPASARPRSPKGSRAASCTARCRTCSRARPCSRSTWARCSPARATAAISRSGSSR